MSPKSSRNKLIRLALAEDLGRRDITTAALGLKGSKGRAEVVAKQNGIISGTRPFCDVFRELSTAFSFEILRKDGSVIRKGDRVIAIRGPLHPMLIGERTSMNLLCHLSGVATLTAKYVKCVKGHAAGIYDTRKTMPGLRNPEKKAVRDGGGNNHRAGLYDMYLIKENHIAAAGGLENALRAAARHRMRTGAPLEVEVRNLRELKTALAFEPDFLLLDNFTIAELKRAVTMTRKIGSKTTLEASGNIDLKNVRRVAATGVSRISIGRITHSAPAFDFSFRVIGR